MMFAGLDIDYGDDIAVDMVDTRTLIQFTVIGKVLSYAQAGERKHVKIETKNRPILINEKSVRRIAFIEERPSLLINI